MIREEGKKLEAESQEGEKLTSAEIEGDVNEAKEGGKVVATEVTSDALSNRKRPRRKRQNWPTGEQIKKRKVKKR